MQTSPLETHKVADPSVWFEYPLESSRLVVGAHFYCGTPPCFCCDETLACTVSPGLRGPSASGSCWRYRSCGRPELGCFNIGRWSPTHRSLVCSVCNCTR